MTSDPETAAPVLAIRGALRDGLNAMALDLVRRASAADASPELLYLGALACARMHATDEAADWLARVDIEALDDVALASEAWSLAGRIAKDRCAALRRAAPGLACEHARDAIAAYRRAFDGSRSPYPIVNAATMASIAGDAALARTLAQQALAACEQSPADTHWWHATRGEALLLLERLDDARDEYARAARRTGHAYGDVATMRRQLWLIGTPAALSVLEQVPAPAVIAFSGHMIDAPDRTEPRFPPSIEPAVAAALRDRIAAYGAAIGFCQAACGADLLFIEAMQQASMQTNIVLPCAVRDFIGASVGFAGDAWVERFHRALARATSVVLATEEPLLGDTVLFEHTSNLIRGMARLRAIELETQPLLLTVSDAGEPAHQGGTTATSEAWRRSGARTDNIALAPLRGDSSVRRTAASAAASAAGNGGRRSLKSLVFADIKGFSQIPEAYTPRFAEVFLGTCKRLLDALDERAVDANTRGDGIFLVFEQPADAASFAVRLQRAIADIDWTRLGLPAETTARIGLHTGPVFETDDPVMGKRTFYGTHVNRAARLEPVVQPGHIFATEAFAASLVASGDERFACHYIGTLPLAKQFGEARLYRIVASTA